MQKKHWQKKNPLLVQLIDVEGVFGNTGKEYCRKQKLSSCNLQMDLWRAKSRGIFAISTKNLQGCILLEGSLSFIVDDGLLQKLN